MSNMPIGTSISNELFIREQAERLTVVVANHLPQRGGVKQLPALLSFLVLIRLFAPLLHLQNLSFF